MLYLNYVCHLFTLGKIEVVFIFTNKKSTKTHTQRIKRKIFIVVYLNVQINYSII